MGFGFKQARAAGAPFLGPRSDLAVNLETLLKEHPHLRTKAANLIRRHKGYHKQNVVFEIVLQKLLESGMAGNFWLDLYRGPDGEEYVGRKLSNDESELRGYAAWGLKTRVYTHALLYSFNSKTGKWSEGEEFLPTPRLSPERS